MQPVTFLDDLLRSTSVTFDLARNEEMSTAGSGDIWGAEQAPPLWVAGISLADVSRDVAAMIDARVRYLGTNGTALISDPLQPILDVPGPVTVAAIASDRGSLSLAGLPAGQAITGGVRLSVEHGVNRVFYGELAFDAVADGAGVTPLMPVTPWIAYGVQAGQSVELARPVCKMAVVGHQPHKGDMDGNGRGASLQLRQKF
ncbi:hypothetical protein [Pseudooceanicola sp. MF1-13]|uniref:hypothetical protein n=1 Tax=Pseudooceanicola sp. MF1-13 TaxID=3379095 RepID=UPI003892A2D3